MTTETRSREPSSEEAGSQIQRAKMLSALVAATNILLVNRDLAHALHCAIDALGAHLSFDRVYLMLRDSKARQWEVIEEWAAPQIVRWLSLDAGFNLRDNDFREVVDVLLRGAVYQSVHAERDGKNADVNEQTGSKSDVIVPIFVKEQIWGCIGFDDCQCERRWNKSELDVLKGAAAAIAGAVERAESEQSFADFREKAAKEHAAELVKANEAMQATIDCLATIADLDDFVPAALRVAAAAFGSEQSLFYIHPSVGPIQLRYWLRGHRVLAPSEIRAFGGEQTAVLRQLVEGFEVPDDHLGTPVRARTHAVIVDHVRGSAVPAFDVFCRNHGMDVELNVPLVVGGAAQGAMLFFRAAGESFSASEIALAEALGKQIALAMQATQVAEVAKSAALAREQQKSATQRAEELTLANAALSRSVGHLTSAGNLTTFLDAVLQEAVATSGAVSGGIFLHDDQTDLIFNRAHVIRGELIDIKTDIRGEAFQNPVPSGGNYVWEVVATQKQILWLDYENPYPQDWPQSKAYHDAMGHRFVAVIPMLHGDVALGFLGMAYDKSIVVQPTQNRLELCKVLAQQATLAVRLSRLAEEAQQAAVAREQEKAATIRAQELDRTNTVLEREVSDRRNAETVARGQANAVSRIAGALLAEPDFNRFLDVALRTITEELDAPGSCMWLYNKEDGMTLNKCCTPAVPDLELLPSTPVALSSGHPWVASLVAKRQSVVHCDIQDDSDMADFNSYYRALKADSALSVPIVRGNKLLGQVNVYGRRGRVWTPAFIELAEALIRQVALAEQLTRLAEAAQQSAVARERDWVVAQERSRMAREIHDTLAQGFAAILVHIQSFKMATDHDVGSGGVNTLKVVERLAKDNLSQARKTMEDLRTDPFERSELQAALQLCIDKERHRSGIRISLDMPSGMGSVQRYVEKEICRIVEEALRNVHRHARTDKARVQVSGAGARLIVAVFDQGVGFQPEEVQMSFGLRGMRERAARAGGDLEIISTPGRGTEIRLTLGGLQ